MNNLKIMLKNKKVVIGVIVTLLIAGSVGGYFIYDNNRKNEILEKMAITFTDVKEIEYGTKDFDVKKELIKEIKDCELTGDIPNLDTSKIGETTLKFTLSKSDVTKEIEHTIKIVDTKAPEISLEADSKELTIGDEYDFKSNIKSVTDVVDGDIALDNKAIEVNKKATEEYNKLKKEDIKEDTKIADKKLDDFLIETIKGDDEKETTQLYLKNCYYTDGSIDVATAGEYTVNVIAVDKNGLKSTKEFIVNVKEKEVEKAPVVNNGGGSGSSSSSGGGYTSNGNSGSSSGGDNNSGGGTVQRGSKQDIINTAIAQLGKPYQLGAAGPNAFDCSGLIYYAYTQNGWSIPRYPESGGTRISADQVQTGDIYYLPDNGQGGSHVGISVSPGKWIEASNSYVHYAYGNPAQNPTVIFIRY